MQIINKNPKISIAGLTGGEVIIFSGRFCLQQENTTMTIS